MSNYTISEGDQDDSDSYDTLEDGDFEDRQIMDDQEEEETKEPAKRGRGRPKGTTGIKHKVERGSKTEIEVPIDKLKELVLTQTQKKRLGLVQKRNTTEEEKKAKADRLREMHRKKREEKEAQKRAEEEAKKAEEARKQELLEKEIKTIKMKLKEPKYAKKKKLASSSESRSTPVHYPSDDETEATETASETPAPIRRIRKKLSKAAETKERLDRLKNGPPQTYQDRSIPAYASFFPNW